MTCLAGKGTKQDVPAERHALRVRVALACGVIILTQGCGRGPAWEEDLGAIPYQTATERTVHSPEILATDTLDFTWSRVGKARLDDERNAYVQDQATQSIVKFSADGRFVGQLGTRGPGPGELAAIRNFDVRADGTVFVADGDGSRITVFDAQGAFVREKAAGGSQPLVAVTDGSIFSSRFMVSPKFSALSEELDSLFTFGHFAGDPLTTSLRTSGDVDGFSNGFALVSQHTGFLFAFGDDGRPIFGMRGIDLVDHQEVSAGADGRIRTGDVTTMLVNATDTRFYVNSTAPYDREGILYVDVYATSTGEYEFSFPLPNPLCGPRYVDETEIIAACTDGVVLRQKVWFE